LLIGFSLQSDEVCTRMCDILGVRTISAAEQKSTANQDVVQQYGGVGWVRLKVCLRESNMTTLLMRGALLYAFGKRHPSIVARRDIMYRSLRFESLVIGA
jgi:hypothetical protein